MPQSKEVPAATTLGLGQNAEAALSYLFGFVSGIIFLILERKNRFVRFHAMQSVILSLGFIIASIAVKLVPLVLTVLFILVWLFVMYQAWQGNRYKMPFAGDLAEQQTAETEKTASDE